MSTQFYEFVAYLINIVDKAFVTQTLALLPISKLLTFRTFYENNEANIIQLYDQRRYFNLKEILSIVIYAKQ